MNKNILTKMIPDSIVTSLKWSRKLAKTGWGWQQAEYVWFSHLGYSNLISMHDTAWTWDYGMKKCLYPALTAEELLQKLPNVEIFKEGSSYRIMKRATKNDPIASQRICRKLSDGLANLYCYLKENNLLPPPK